MPIDPRVKIVADAIAVDSGWPIDYDSDDYQQAIGTAEVAVDALEDRGWFDG